MKTQGFRDDKSSALDIFECSSSCETLSEHYLGML